MRFKEELKPKGKKQVRNMPKLTQLHSFSYHSHLIDPGTGLAFLASKPQARTWPCSSYNRQVGTFLNVSIDPGQCRICCTFPAAIRDEPYAYDNTPFDRNTAEDADTTYHARESSSCTPKNVSSRGTGCSEDPRHDTHQSRWKPTSFLRPWAVQRRAWAARTIDTSRGCSGFQQRDMRGSAVATGSENPWDQRCTHPCGEVRRVVEKKAGASYGSSSTAGAGTEPRRSCAGRHGPVEER